jgi:predicted TIM-barrel fold metal-dependent hydrolase
MIIDSHTHVWVNDPVRFPWQPVGGYIPDREAPIGSLVELMDKAGVDRAVLVQPTPYGWDNSYILSAAREFPDRLSTVCLVNPHLPSAELDLKQLVQAEGVKGVRFNWNFEPEHNWTEDLSHTHLWEIAEQLKLLVCLQFVPQQIEQVSRIASTHPQVKIVLDHLGRPEPGSPPDSPAFRRFLALAEKPNCFAKICGMHYYSSLKAPFQDTWAMLAAVVRAFGAQRCLFGSDFPFVLDHWSYPGLLERLSDILEANKQEMDWILSQTAVTLSL